MKRSRMALVNRHERGAVAIIVGAFLLLAGIGFAAFAVDFSYRHVWQNKLQNAADAGALAGARALYYEDYSQVNNDGGGDYWDLSANEIAYRAARDNYGPDEGYSAEELAELEIDFDEGSPGTNTPDVARGHWSFGNGDLSRGFEPWPGTEPIILGDYDEIELDGMPAFVNAVKVKCRRHASPVRTFFARIFGRESFRMIEAEAVAWRQYSDELPPFEVDTIVAICMDSIVDMETGDHGMPGVLDPQDDVLCNYGRMLNSGGDENNHNTGGWTNYDQPETIDDTCEHPNADELKTLLETCSPSPESIAFFNGLGVTGGTVDIVFRDLMECWNTGTFKYDFNHDGEIDEDTEVISVDHDDDPTTPPVYPWTVTLPVIRCEARNPANCSEVVGGIKVHIVWMNLKNIAHIDADAPWGPMFNPLTEGNWVAEAGWDGETRWDSFVGDEGDGFRLQTVASDPNDPPPEYATVANGGFKAKSIYFLPDCEPIPPTGGGGHTNLGDLSDIPVLVK